MTAEVKPLRLNPMHQRPGAGRRITVWMRDGRRLECHATKVVSNAGTGIVIYHKRKAIDEMKAEGWSAAAIDAARKPA